MYITSSKSFAELRARNQRQWLAETEFSLGGNAIVFLFRLRRSSALVVELLQIGKFRMKIKSCRPPAQDGRASRSRETANANAWSMSSKVMGMGQPPSQAATYTFRHQRFFFSGTVLPAASSLEQARPSPRWRTSSIH